MDALVGLIQKDDFPLTELILAENKLKNDIHDFINALGSNQSLQKLGRYLVCTLAPYTTYSIHTQIAKWPDEEVVPLHIP